MNKYIQLVFGAITFNEFVVYLGFALLGFILSILIELYNARKKINKKGGFTFYFWMSDNLFRIIISIIVMIVGVLFTENILGVEITNYTAFLAGFTTDKIIESLKKKK